MTSDAYVRALRQTIKYATDEAWQSGDAFYPAARAIAAEHLYGAAILAAYSPRMQWSVNVRKARETFATGRAMPTLGATMAAVTRALAGQDPWDGRPALKVRSFAANLSGDDDAVTVDVWHCRACGLTDRLAPTARQYHDIAAATRRVAREYDVTPCTLQAVAWFAVRGVKPSDQEITA